MSKRGLRRRRRSKVDGTKVALRRKGGASQQDAAAETSAAEPPLRAEVRQLIRLEQPQKALALYEERVATDADAFPAVMRALLKMRRIELAMDLYERHAHELSLDVDTRSAVTLFLALCRTRRLDEAMELFHRLEASHPTPEDAAWDGRADAGASADAGADAAPDEPLWHARGSVMLPSLILAYLGQSDVSRASQLARRLGEHAACIPEAHVMTKLVREFGKSRSLRGVYACLDAQAAAAQDADADGLQAMVDAIVRDCRFVKGGVSMATLPTAPLPEVAFVGRSNVGKSSMVNMILGRRALAYTSKTPGKTQQYNYFVLNEPTDGPFHVVDMPGLGYAKVPGAERRKWLAFLEEYAAQRPQLRLIVHLIDGQVGPLETDEAIMRMVRDARAAAIAVGGDEPPWRYAVCLTKFDKGGPKACAHAERAVLRAVEEAGCPPPVGVVPTSSKSKAGRADMWRLLRGVVLHGEQEEEREDPE